ncbi:MAG: ATP-dependent metallopeptidase FtsH/Yme1/Tma family protein, partial [Myxococcales bacterium]|nr:ATP-dependent metallopeptidase FtsH/Yme1/Tma family protein [Myxococcales bacterium]
MNQQFYKNMALWVVILVVILLLVTMLNQDEVAPPELAFSEFLSNVEDSNIESLVIEEGAIKGKLNDGSEFTTFAPVVTQELIVLLREHDVRFSARPKDEGSFWRQILIMWFPLLLFIGLWIFFIRQMQSGG